MLSALVVASGCGTERRELCVDVTGATPVDKIDTLELRVRDAAFFHVSTAKEFVRPDSNGRVCTNAPVVDSLMLDIHDDRGILSCPKMFTHPYVSHDGITVLEVWRYGPGVAAGDTESRIVYVAMIHE